MPRLIPTTAFLAALVAPAFAAAQEAPSLDGPALEAAPSPLAPASVDTPPSMEDLLSGPEVGQVDALSDDELDSERGGFLTPLGFEVGFGAVVRTTIDGALALETKLTWTDMGAVTSVTAGQAMSAAENAAMAAAGGIHLGDAANWTGVVIPGDGGATALMQNFSDSTITSLVVNTANNRDIQQTTDINLYIPQLDLLQQTAISNQLQSNLMNAVGNALRDATLK